jgi:uncharacterized protein (TIGR02246 family)
MPATTTPTRDDIQIRQRIDEWLRALCAKDIDAVMAHYAPDMVVYDLMPLQLKDINAYRKNFEAWFGSVQGRIEYEIHDMRLATSQDVALGHYVGRVRYTRTTGEKNDYWVRVTMGLHKTNGQWLVTHEHVSLPFPNMETMRAALASSQKGNAG